ncbi:MAG TPA: DUF4296 domain-containing protein [Chitinophagaceae bacterium]|nr:DUF4296 domain-containing protein [Chitinophagaceae bacterium]
MKGMLALIIVLLLSCNDKAAVPKEIIPVPKMTNLLWDVMLADGLTNYRYAADTIKRFDTSIVLYQQIAKAHGTTQKQFKKSMQFYEGRPDLLQIIFDSLQKRYSNPVPAIRQDTSQKAVQ